MATHSIIKPTHHDLYPFISPLQKLKESAKGRTVLIAGAGSGIGKAIARAFAQASAHTVVLIGRTAAKLEGVHKSLAQDFPDTNILLKSVDISDDKAVEQLFEEFQQHDLHPDVLINSAGVHVGRAHVADTTPDLWWKNWEIMLKGPYLMTRSFLKQLQGQPVAVINVSSIGSYAMVPNANAYGPCKAALNRFTEYIAMEYKEKNVQAMAFHPGGVADTDLTRNAPSYLIPHFTEKPELAAGVALFLTTPRASWLSGLYVDARWDMQELEKSKEAIESGGLLRMSLIGDERMTM